MPTEPDIYALLEIAPETPEEKTAPSNLYRHVAIRAGIMVAIVIFIALDVGLEWNIGEHGSYAGLGAIFIGLIIFAVWIIFMLIEIIVLHFNKRPNFRNANLLTVFTVIIASVLLFASLIGLVS